MSTEQNKKAKKKNVKPNVVQNELPSELEADRTSANTKTSAFDLLSETFKSPVYLDFNKVNFNSIRSPLDDYLSGSLRASRQLIESGLVRSSSEVRESFYTELQEERKKVRELQKTLEAVQVFSADDRQTIAQWEKKEKINHILGRISNEAGNALIEDLDFQGQFEDGREIDSVVISIDIRRSTELMLKARTPSDYSTFITELRGALETIILKNHGIFDKFTGDGILAFFPTFFSGSDAILWALKAAEECHGIFKSIYYNHRHCFNIFLKEIGLGIGVDYGTVTLMNKKHELTVVGIPVVYACRMSGAPAGQTLLNGKAYEELENKGIPIDVNESEIEIKNEGMAIAYIPGPLKRHKELGIPEWLSKLIYEEEDKNEDEEDKSSPESDKTE